MVTKSWRILGNSRKQADLRGRRWGGGVGKGQQGGKSLHPFFFSILQSFLPFFLTPIPEDPLIL